MNLFTQPFPLLFASKSLLIKPRPIWLPLMICIVYIGSITWLTGTNPPVIDSPCNELVFCDTSNEDDIPNNGDQHESCDGIATLTLIAHDDNTAADELVFQWQIFDGAIPDLVLFEGSGNDASAEYPYGLYSIHWTVTDVDGNQSTCDYLFSINDCLPPAVGCYHNMAVELIHINTLPTGYDSCVAYIWASELIQDVDDNCTPLQMLYLRVQKENQGIFEDVSNPLDLPSNLIITCSDYQFNASNGYHVPFKIWLGDQVGSWDTCISSVNIQNSFGCNCPPIDSSLVSTINMADETPDPYKVFPNPFSGDFEVAYPKQDASDKVSYQICALTGEIFKEETISNADGIFHINGDNIPQGVYMITLIVNNIPIATKRIIKI